LKLLLDTCVWGGAVQALVQRGHDVLWSGVLVEDPGDEEILAQAYRDGRILVTLDKVFGEMAVRYGKPHSGIIRLVGISARVQARVCQEILDNYAQELLAGALITVDLNRIRIRRP